MNERTTLIRRPATYQDVLDAPPHKVAELIRGTLLPHPRPASAACQGRSPPRCGLDRLSTKERRAWRLGDPV